MMMSNEEKEKILKKFSEKLISNQQNIPPEFRLSDEDFFKLLRDNPESPNPEKQL